MSKTEVTPEMREYAIKEFQQSPEYEDLRNAGVILDHPTVENATLSDVIKNKGGNINHSLINPESIEEKEDENEYWGQYRGDYLDLRDYCKAETYDEKKNFLKNISKARVTLIREHILSIWTFCPKMRQELEPELESINMVMYSDKQELENEDEVKENKTEAGCSKDIIN